MILHKTPQTKTQRYDARPERRTRGGTYWKIRYGNTSCLVLIKDEWATCTEACPEAGCITVSGPALEAVETAIAWDKDLRAESKRLG